MTARVVRVGVAAILRRRRDGAVLMGMRCGSHGAGTWSFPGGHLEFGESVEVCASRETAEETGIYVVAGKFRCAGVSYTNDVFDNERKHYVTLYVVADDVDGEPRILEPEKCARWAWCRMPPEPLFLPVTNLLDAGFDPWRART